MVGHCTACPSIRQGEAVTMPLIRYGGLQTRRCSTGIMVCGRPSAIIFTRDPVSRPLPCHNPVPSRTGRYRPSAAQGRVRRSVPRSHNQPSPTRKYSRHDVATILSLATVSPLAPQFFRSTTERERAGKKRPSPPSSRCRVRLTMPLGPSRGSPATARWPLRQRLALPRAGR
jgi:hypothetical protein